MIIDLHTHTFPSSDDSFQDVDTLIQRAREVGLDGICLTEHDRFWDPGEVAELSRRHRFLVLPGCEVTTEEGHLLVFGLHRYIFGMHRARFVWALAREQGAAVVLAHPYRRNFLPQEARSPEAEEGMLRRTLAMEVFSLVDAVEVANGRGTPRENAFSREVGRRLGLPGTGASDAHRPQDLGTWATEFLSPIDDLDDLVRELRAGRFRPVCLRG